MGKIEPRDDAACLCCGSDSLDIEQLAREKIYTGKHHHRELIGVLLDQIDNIFRLDCELAFTRACENKRVFWSEPMMSDLRFDCIGVGRKRRFFHQDFEPRFGWPIKRRHHEMEVYREAVHADYLQWFRANKPRGRFAQCLVIGVPWGSRSVMRIDTELRPSVQFFFDDFSRRFWHQA